MNIKAKNLAPPEEQPIDISEEWPEGEVDETIPPGLSAGKEESDYHESHRVGLPAQRPCLGVVQLHPGMDG